MRYSHEDDYEDDESKYQDHDFEDDFDDDDELEYEIVTRKIQLEKTKIKIVEVALKQQMLRRKLLLDAISASQKSFWWNFCNWKTKLKWITSTYEVFVNLVLGPPTIDFIDDDDEIDEEDENFLD